MNGRVEPRKDKAGAPRRRQIGEHDLLTAGGNWDLLVEWSGLVVLLVEVGWQKRKVLGPPDIVVGASVTKTRLPVPADRPKGHRLVVAVHPGHRIVVLFGVGKR